MCHEHITKHKGIRRKKKQQRINPIVTFPAGMRGSPGVKHAKGRALIYNRNVPNCDESPAESRKSALN